ncbi:MAG: hypothetical protein NUV49_02465, partial [Patescibacteria group bacterium]|nr:hypothetical protein [Patescibacteria group bacterium]
NCLEYVTRCLMTSGFLFGKRAFWQGISDMMSRLENIEKLRKIFDLWLDLVCLFLYFCIIQTGGYIQ